MSYTLIEERKVKAAKKSHRCVWCSQSIDIGSPYTYERSVFDGRPQSHHWHDECLEQMQAEARYEGGTLEFTPGENERPIRAEALEAFHTH